MSNNRDLSKKTRKRLGFKPLSPRVRLRELDKVRWMDLPTGDLYHEPKITDRTAPRSEDLLLPESDFQQTLAGDGQA